MSRLDPSNQFYKLTALGFENNPDDFLRLEKDVHEDLAPIGAVGIVTMPRKKAIEDMAATACEDAELLDQQADEEEKSYRFLDGHGEVQQKLTVKATARYDYLAPQIARWLGALTGLPQVACARLPPGQPHA